MSAKVQNAKNSEAGAAKRDFAVGIALVAVLPVLVAVHMSLNVVPSADILIVVSLLTAWGMTLILGMLGVLVLWRYCWATVELRIYLDNLVSCDTVVSLPDWQKRRTSPWLLKLAVNFVVSEQRKRMYALELEKAALERNAFIRNCEG